MIFSPSLGSSRFLGSAPERSMPPRLFAVRAMATRTAAAPPASLYDVLGLAPGATGKEIKSAYRRLARTCHPDVVARAGLEGGTADEFLRVHAAYVTLSDPEKRADYDRELTALSWRRRRTSRSTATQTPTPTPTPTPSSSPRSGAAVYSNFAGSGRRSWETDQCW